MGSDSLKPVQVFGSEEVFQEEEPELVDVACKSNCLGRGEAFMDVVEEFDVIAKSISDFAEHAKCESLVLAGVKIGPVLSASWGGQFDVVSTVETLLNANMQIAIFDQSCGVRRYLFGTRSICVHIDLSGLT